MFRAKSPSTNQGMRWSSGTRCAALSVGSHDAFVAYYDASGNQKFFRTYGGPLEPRSIPTHRLRLPATAVSRDRGFEDRINFGGGDLVSTGNRDIYLLQLSAAGTHLFSSAGASQITIKRAVFPVLPDGDVIVSGTAAID